MRTNYKNFALRDRKLPNIERYYQDKQDLNTSIISMSDLDESFQQTFGVAAPSTGYTNTRVLNDNLRQSLRTENTQARNANIKDGFNRNIRTAFFNQESLFPSHQRRKT